MKLRLVNNLCVQMVYLSSSLAPSLVAPWLGEDCGWWPPGLGCAKSRWVPRWVQLKNWKQFCRTQGEQLSKRRQWTSEEGSCANGTGGLCKMRRWGAAHKKYGSRENPQLVGYLQMLAQLNVGDGALGNWREGGRWECGAVQTWGPLSGEGGTALLCDLEQTV